MLPSPEGACGPAQAADLAWAGQLPLLPLPPHPYPPQHVLSFWQHVFHSGLAITLFPSLGYSLASGSSSSLSQSIQPASFQDLQRQPRQARADYLLRILRSCFCLSSVQISDNSSALCRSMMLTNRDPNASGCTSRASNRSAISRATGRHVYTAGKDFPLGGPGVMSMLRTATEMGNVVSPIDDTSGLSSIPRAPQRRVGSSRLSTASSISNHSSMTSRHHRRQPSISSAPRHSMREPQYVSDTLSPTPMNFPGSSPYVLGAHDRDAPRSLSMTTTTQPMHMLSSNESLGSLRRDQVPQLARSPYMHPSGFRAPSHRPVSPALSDITGSRPRRLYSHGSHGQQYVLNHGGLKVPSDTNLGHRRDRTHRPRGPIGPSRVNSPVYFLDSAPNVPPVPVIPRKHQPRRSGHRALWPSQTAQGSMSSDSMNARTASSETPSSDPSSPPTPQSLQVQSPAIAALVNSNPRPVFQNWETKINSPELPPLAPAYYDYSEPFHPHGRNENRQLGSVAGSTGYKGFKTITEEHIVSELYVNQPNYVSPKASDGEVPSITSEIAELPASPVPRRITRELVREALGPASSTGEATSFERSETLKARTEPHGLNASQRDDCVESVQASMHPTDDSNNRYSILSQTGSSVLNSSTLEFAVRYSIPMASGNGIRAVGFSESEPVLPTTPGKSTEDGMSELLAGYQHTDTKQAVDNTEHKESESKEDAAFIVEPVEKRSHHDQKSSAEQSFKSCTDLPKVSTEQDIAVIEKEKEPRSFPLGVDDLDDAAPAESSIKESDAHSFQTAKDAVTPDRYRSQPPTRLPSSALAKEITHSTSPESKLSAPSPPPPAVVRKPVPVRELSFATMAHKSRATSKSSMKQGSMSLSASSSTLDMMQPPIVPPRESSSSKEAQTHKGVASFLMNLPARLSRSLKPVVGGEYSKSEGDLAGPSKATIVEAPPNLDLSLSVIATPEKVVVKQQVLPESPVVESLPQDRRIFDATSVETMRVLHQSARSSASPLPAFEASSVYSPEQHSLPMRVYSSPSSTGPQSIQFGQRDSLTTTHLDWPNSQDEKYAPAAASTGHLPLSVGREAMTTDLRLSQYRYAAPPRNLSDLREESHEDSSLNTSANNLKRSSIRFPVARSSGVRASVDDVAVYTKRSSAGSQRHGTFGETAADSRGLPSMRFSQSNLFEELQDKFGLHSARFSRNVVAGSAELLVESPSQSASPAAVGEHKQSLAADLEEARGAFSVYQAREHHVEGSRRALSPEGYMAEIDQVTIPSVNGLTTHISELLNPSFKKGYQGDLQEDEGIVKRAREEIQELQPAQKRSSARLRPMPGSLQMMVVDDDVYQELTFKNVVAVNGCQSEVVAKAGVVDGVGDASQNGSHVVRTHQHQPGTFAELELPAHAVLRPRAVTSSQLDYRRSGDSALSSTRSLRSVGSTPTATDTRPWNSDKNYPWTSSNIPSVDISLPPATLVTSSPRPGPSHLRNTLASSSTSSVITTTSFSSSPTATFTPFGLRPDSNGHARRHRFSNLGHGAIQPHTVGDRYPTSALSPPSASAMFNDGYTVLDDSDGEDFNTNRKPKRGLIKRFSSARNTSGATARTKTNPAELASPKSTKQSPGVVLEGNTAEHRFAVSNRHTFRDAQGMTPIAYHRQRIIEGIKHLLHRGSDFFRGLARRNKLASPPN